MGIRKRGQGEGSVFQRASDLRWVGSVSLGGGRRRYVYGKTAAEAREKLDALKRSISDGNLPLVGHRTVRQLFEAWLEAKEGTVRPKTFESYSGLIRKHVLPHLGDTRVSKLGVSDLERLYAERSQHISAKTLRNLHFVVEAALTWANRRDWIARNPASLIAKEDLPRVYRREPRVLSVAQARALMDISRGTKSETLITLALVTGARVGELLGLTWDRVDLDEARIKITHALQFLDGKPELVEPKTRAGVRELAMAPNAVAVLRAHRVSQNETALSLGAAWQNDMNLVFTTPTGAPLNRHAVLRQYLRPLLGVAGLPMTTRFHDLRHGAASLLLSQGIPIPIVSEMLGHANPAITMSIYSHALPDSQSVVAEAMAEMFGGD